jgi:hypothetical protein
MCFGGSEKVTQINKQELSPEQSQLLNFGMASAKSAMDTQPALPGVAGFDSAQTAAQNSTLAKAGSGGTISNMADQGAANQQFLTNGVLDLKNNASYQGALDAALRPITENFQNVVLPGLRTNAIQAGPAALGGSREKLAEANASGAYMRQLGDTSASMGNDAYKTGVEAATKAQALLPNTLQAMLYPETATEAVGAQRRAMAQEVANQPMAQNSLDWSRALQLLGSSGSIPGGGTSGEVTPATGGANAATAGIGTALALLALL